MGIFILIIVLWVGFMISLDLYLKEKKNRDYWYKEYKKAQAEKLEVLKILNEKD